MNPAPGLRTHYPALDGLRGMAILLVVFFHNFGFIRSSNFGWLGVDLFFVLSGFLITGILMDEKEQPGFLRRFYLRRIFRIFPLYYAVLILFLIVCPMLGWFRMELNYYQENQWWLWAYLQNWLYSFRLESGATLLNHFWSLAVEEQFYLIWPFLVLWIRKPQALFRVMSFLLIAVLAARSAVWMAGRSDVNYTTLYTFTRIDGICIGSMLALLMRSRPELIGRYFAIIVMGLAGLNYVFYFVNQAAGSQYPYFAFVGYTTFCALFALLVHELVKGTSPLLDRMFRMPPLRYLGKISYGFYVFHWPVYVLTRPPLNQWLQSDLVLSPKQSELAVAVVSTTLALLLSILSYHTYERYFLTMKERYARS